MAQRERWLWVCANLGAATLGACADSADARPAIIDSNPDASAPRDDLGNTLVAIPMGDASSQPLDVSGVDRAAVVDIPRIDAASPVDAARVDASGSVRVYYDSGVPLEACGDGVDNDRDGRVDEDCPATMCTAAPRTRTVARVVSVDRAPSLWSALMAQRLTVLTTLPDTDAEYDETAIMVLDAETLAGDATRAAQIRRWVDAGGALFTVIIGLGAAAPTECDPPNTVLTPFGVTYSCDAPAPYGPAGAASSHPITAGLTVAEMPFVNGRWVDARPGIATSVIATVHGVSVARAFTSGCGRVVVWGDEHVGFSSYGASTQTFWNRAVSWLLAR